MARKQETRPCARTFTNDRDAVHKYLDVLLNAKCVIACRAREEGGGRAGRLQPERLNVMQVATHRLVAQFMQRLQVGHANKVHMSVFSAAADDLG